MYRTTIKNKKHFFSLSYTFPWKANSSISIPIPLPYFFASKAFSFHFRHAALFPFWKIDPNSLYGISRIKEAMSLLFAHVSFPSLRESFTNSDGTSLIRCLHNPNSFGNANLTILLYISQRINSRLFISLKNKLPYTIKSLRRASIPMHQH